MITSLLSNKVRYIVYQCSSWGQTFLARERSGPYGQQRGGGMGALAGAGEPGHRRGSCSDGMPLPRDPARQAAVAAQQRWSDVRPLARGLGTSWLAATGAFLLVVALLLLQGCAGPAPRAAGDGAAAGSETGVVAGQLPDQKALLESDYRIGANDLLEIGVLGVSDLNRTVRVNSSGAISMPLIGMVDVAGLTSGETEALLEKEYEKEYLQDPQISVFIKEFTSQRFTVDGAVSRPGVYPLVGKMTLLRALATAGGKGELADLENVMLFRVAEDGDIEKSQYDVLKIRTGEEPDPVLQRDDVVVVNRNASRVTFRDSLFRDILDALNPFSSTYSSVAPR